jgi:hypothetical protein
MIKIVLLIVSALLYADLAQATPFYSYVGSYDVADGPEFSQNPTVYSALEAAALIFGGTTAHYAISINPDQSDPNTITFSGWYDGIGEHQGLIFNQDFKYDEGAPGYYDPGTVGSAYSAYVLDGLIATNYVWRVENVNTPVPEPSTFLLLGAGIVGLVLLRKKGNQYT